MQKISWIQWFVRIVKKDMTEYEEDAGTKQEVYRVVKRKSKAKKNRRGEDE